MEKFLIYAREDCGFCTKLLNYMKESDERFVYVLVYNLEESLHTIMERYKWRTVPLVLKMEDGDEQGKLLGGCDDTIKYLEGKRSRDDSLPTGRDN